MFIYLAIFFSKIIENALSTLRLILVANGKKKIGALLQGLIALVWILVTGIVIIDINKDLLKIVFFCLGSLYGSYLGSIIEEKIALGNVVLIGIVKQIYEDEIRKKLSKFKNVTIIEENNKLSIILVLLKRKEINDVSSIFKEIDKNSILISEKAKFINNIV